MHMLTEPPLPPGTQDPGLSPQEKGNSSACQAPMDFIASPSSYAEAQPRVPLKRDRI